MPIRPFRQDRPGRACVHRERTRRSRSDVEVLLVDPPPLGERVQRQRRQPVGLWVGGLSPHLCRRTPARKWRPGSGRRGKRQVCRGRISGSISTRSTVRGRWRIRWPGAARAGREQRLAVAREHRLPDVDRPDQPSRGDVPDAGLSVRPTVSSVLPSGVKQDDRVKLLRGRWRKRVVPSRAIAPSRQRIAVSIDGGDAEAATSALGGSCRCGSPPSRPASTAMPAPAEINVTTASTTAAALNAVATARPRPTAAASNGDARLDHRAAGRGRERRLAEGLRDLSPSLTAGGQHRGHRRRC